MGLSSDPTRRQSESSQRLRSAMRAHQAGDREAFDCIYALLAPRLRRMLISLARDEHRAEDLLQETFLHIHRARRTYDPAYSVEGWAHAIARNVFLMDYRARSRREGQKVAPLSEAHEPAVRAHEDGVVAEDQLEKGLARLTPGRRSAVLLRHLRGWSFAEISEALGISERLARQRSSRGMALLRGWLRKTRGDDDD